METPPQNVPLPRLKLKFLDGMRGLAALYVLLFHQYSPRELPAGLTHWLVWMRFGHYAVAVFIVLSGYSLMIPIVRSPDGKLTGGLGGFLRRRARRILPPYYFALAATVLIAFLSRRLMGALHLSTGASDAGSAFGAGDLVTHLLLIHNWFRDYNFGINGTHWSVATEWQIYFLFALLLLPVWRRFGPGAAAGLGLALGVAPLLLLPAGHNLSWAGPQYLGLFAFGMAGATLSFSARAPYTSLRAQLPLGPIAALLSAGFVALAMFGARAVGPTGELEMSQPWVADVFLGLAMASLICWCARAAQSVTHARQPLVLRFLECGWVTRLGVFSYSIYLISLPIEEKIRVALYKVTHTDFCTSVAMLLVGVPVTLGCCYLFHLACERPFLSGLAKKKTAQDVSVLPASE